MKTIYQISKAKDVKILSVLAAMGIDTYQASGNEVKASSPLSSDRSPSFFVNIESNVFNDFSTGEKGDSIRLIQKLYNLSFPDAVDWLLDFEGQAIEPAKPIGSVKLPGKEKMKFVKAEPLSDLRLLRYGNSRGISTEILKQYCEQITYQNGNRQYRSIGFKNDFGGYELRSKNFKSFIGSKKGITTINAGQERAIVFEGFFSFLSWTQLAELKRMTSTFIVLNSAVNWKQIHHFSQIVSFHDNDETGRKLFENLKTKCTVISNEAIHFYPESKDLNDHLIKTING